MNSNLADLSKEYYDHFWAGVALAEASRRSVVNIIENRLREISSQIEINGGWIKMIEVNQMTFQPLQQNEQRDPAQQPRTPQEMSKLTTY